MNRDNFAHDFNALSKYLKGFAYKLTEDTTSAEDLFQDTALRAFTYRTSFSSNTNMKAWLSTIMKNVFINNFRNRKRRSIILDQSGGDYLINSALHDPVANEGEKKLLIEEIYQLIDRLEDGLKIPFLMVYQGYKYDEISEEMKLPLGTVKSRVFFARKALKRQITLLNRIPDREMLPS